MSVFILKTLTVAVKALARPVINYFAYYNRIKLQESNNKTMKRLRDGFIFLGQNFNYYNTLFNRKLFKLSSNSPIQPLSADKALERGAELITEFIVYSVIIAIPTIEIIKSQIKSQQKENQKIENINNMRSDLNNIVNEYNSFREEVNEIAVSLKKINEKIHVV